jgi:hypothetical protein
MIEEDFHGQSHDRAAIARATGAPAAEKQQRVVEFARSLVSEDPRLVPGTAWLKFGGLIPPEDLAEMQRAIEEGCERIDPDDWK